MVGHAALVGGAFTGLILAAGQAMAGCGMGEMGAAGAKVGFHTYKLNHWALSWIPDYQPGVTNSWSQLPGGIDEAFHAFGPTNIQETVTLTGAHNGYQGTFTLTQCVNDGTKTPISDVSGAPVAFVIVGTVSATRVTVE